MKKYLSKQYNLIVDIGINNPLEPIGWGVEQLKLSRLKNKKNTIAL